MPIDGFEVIIVGGGFAGTAIAYQLARRQASVLLLEANGIGTGTSGACAGRAQVSESHDGLHLALVLEGIERLSSLEEELDFPFDWRRLGNLMLIEDENYWEEWTERIAHLQERNVPAEMLDRQALQEAEPLLRATGFRGAAWCLEGHLNPFKLCHGYAYAARRQGAILRERTPVRRFTRQGRRLTTVHTTAGDFHANTVIITAGAWTDRVLRLAGTTLPVQFTHAEAMISERVAPSLQNHVGLADFYETIHTASRAVSVGVAQQAAGTLLITEAVQMGANLHHANSDWGPPGMAHELLALFPHFENVRIMRAWAAPSPFLPDEQPAIGWMPALDNLFVATCFHMTISTIPVLSEMISETVLGVADYPSLAQLSPARFAGAAT
jgi:glycine/D-amino acid oxidase-like deaminating enzyme